MTARRRSRIPAPGRRRAIALSAIAFIALLGASVGSTAGATVTVVREPYLVQGRRTEVKVAWKTTTSTTSVVRYGLTSALGQTATGANGTHHTVTIKGLQPGTRYYYRAESSGSVLTSARPFRTLDSVSDPTFRFAVVGDFGAGTTAEQQVADRLRDSHPRLILTTGDNAYPSGTESDFDTKVLPYYEDVLDNIAINASMGNHDMLTDGGAPARRAFAIPSTQRYSFEVSSAHIIVLDSNDDCFTDGCPQVEWLQADLAAAEDRPFIVVVFHHSLSSCGKHGTEEELRAAWHPILAGAGVDLVFMGHDHGYQRSSPIDGITYVTTAGGGAALYTWDTPCPEAVTVLDSTTVGGAHHAVLVDLSPGAARIRAVRGSDGAILDDVTVAP